MIELQEYQVDYINKNYSNLDRPALNILIQDYFNLWATGTKNKTPENEDLMTVEFMDELINVLQLYRATKINLSMNINTLVSEIKSKFIEYFKDTFPNLFEDGQSHHIIF